jgi:hypothetical protein
MPKGMRGYKFNVAEFMDLLKLINKIVPIGSPEWDRV